MRGCQCSETRCTGPYGWVRVLHIIKGNKLVIVDEGKCLRSVAALKVDRLVVSAVEMHHLAWI